MKEMFVTAVILIVIGIAFGVLLMKIFADDRKARIDYQKRLEAEEVKKNEIKESFNTGNQLDNVVNTLDMLDKLHNVKSGKKQ